jgi:glutamate synthase (NADPH/NADH) small chain
MAREVMPRQEMPQATLEARKTSFAEIKLGFTAEAAVAEAKRCIACKQAQCSLKGCPLKNRIPEWVMLTAQGKFMEAATISRTTSNLPEICGRVCPQDRLCEGKCALGIKGEAVAIGAIERFINDYARSQGDIPLPVGAPTGKRVAIVGAGPAGLAAAAELRALGHDVVIYDVQPEPGGLLMYGLPQFKLRPEVVRGRWKLLENAGVKFQGKTRVGEAVSMDDMLKKNDAVFVATGTWLSSVPKLPGRELAGIVQSLEFLKGGPDGMPVSGMPVIVLGGGDTAMDCARSAIRRGATRAVIAYRRDEANMPGSKKEVKMAKEEGVEFILLISPLEFLAGPTAKLRAIKFQKMELGEPDAEGRRSPKPIAGSEFEMAAQMAVMAFGFKLDSDLVTKNLGLGLSPEGNILVNPDTGATTRPGVFSGGDAVLGADLVVRAVVAGRRAAAGIHRFLNKEPWSALMPAPAQGGTQ